MKKFKDVKVNKENGTILFNSPEYLAYYVRYDLLTVSSKEEYEAGGKPPRKEEYLFNYSRIGKEGLEKIRSGERKPVTVSGTFYKEYFGIAEKTEEELGRVWGLVSRNEGLWRSVKEDFVLALTLMGFKVWTRTISGGAWDYDTHVFFCSKEETTYTIKSVENVYVLSMERVRNRYNYYVSKDVWRAEKINCAYVLTPCGMPSAEGLVIVPWYNEDTGSPLLVAELKNAPRLMAYQWNEGMGWTGCGTTPVGVHFEKPAVILPRFTSQEIRVDIENKKVYMEGKTHELEVIEQNPE